MFPVLWKIKPVHILPPYFFTIHFNITVVSMPRLNRPPPSFLFPHQNPVRISLHHAFHRPRIPILFYFCFYGTVYFQYHQHLKAIRHIFRWNRFLCIHRSAFKLIATSLGLGVLISRAAMQFWEYDNFDSFLGVLEWPKCGFIYQRTGFIWLRTWTSGSFFVGTIMNLRLR